LRLPHDKKITGIINRRNSREIAERRNRPSAGVSDSKAGASREIPSSRRAKIITRSLRVSDPPFSPLLGVLPHRSGVGACNERMRALCNDPRRERERAKETETLGRKHRVYVRSAWKQNNAPPVRRVVERRALCLCAYTCTCSCCCAARWCAFVYARRLAARSYSRAAVSFNSQPRFDARARLVTDNAIRDPRET